MKYKFKYSDLIHQDVMGIPTTNAIVEFITEIIAEGNIVEIVFSFHEYQMKTPVILRNVDDVKKLFGDG